MENILIFLGLVIPIGFLIYAYGKALMEVNNGNGDEKCPVSITLGIIVSLFTIIAILIYVIKMNQLK